MSVTEEEGLSVEGTVVGAATLSSTLAHLDTPAKKHTTLAAYRAVQRACEGEGGMRAGAGARQEEQGVREDAESHLGDIDATKYDFHCLVSLRGTTFRVEEGGGGGETLLEVGVESVGVASTVPGDLCRLLVLATPPQAHGFPALPSQPSALVLAVTVSSVSILDQILDRLTTLNPALRESGQKSRTKPPPKPLRASQRKSATSMPEQPEDQRPPLATKRQDRQQEYEEPQLRTREGGEYLHPTSPTNVSGHYPLRGTLSTARAQDCPSGIYDELGPLRPVDEHENDVTTPTDS